jgi:hypothetical protein
MIIGNRIMQDGFFTCYSSCNFPLVFGHLK